MKRVRGEDLEVFSLGHSESGQRLESYSVDKLQQSKKRKPRQQKKKKKRKKAGCSRGWTYLIHLWGEQETIKAA